MPSNPFRWWNLVLGPPTCFTPHSPLWWNPSLPHSDQPLVLGPSWFSWAMTSHVRSHSPAWMPSSCQTLAPTLSHCSSPPEPQHRHLPRAAQPKSFRSEMSRKERKRQEEKEETNWRFNSLVNSFEWNDPSFLIIHYHEDFSESEDLEMFSWKRRDTWCWVLGFNKSVHEGVCLRLWVGPKSISGTLFLSKFDKQTSR